MCKFNPKWSFDEQKSDTINETRKILWRDCKPDELTENKEDITVVWLDENADDSTGFQQIFEKVRGLIDYALLYTDLQLCITYIQSVINEKIFLILSDSMAKAILPCLQSACTIAAIFIFVRDSIYDATLCKYRNNTMICHDQSSLLESIEYRLHLLSKQSIAYSLFDSKKQVAILELAHQSPSFLWFRILVEVLKELPKTSEAKEQMIHVFQHYYRRNKRQLDKIKEFSDLYQPSDAIRWYTENSFLYRFLNKALKVDDIYLLYLVRFYVIDLCKQIEVTNKNYLSSDSCVRLYRGQNMHEKEFEILKTNIGCLISPNGFFSTSESMNVALIYAGEDSTMNKSILFEIRLDPTKIQSRTIVGAPIQQFSRFPDEQEVLFSIGTTFKIEDVVYDKKYKVWRVTITLTDDGLQYVQQHMNLIRNDLVETNSTRLFGKLLIDMGQYSRAERYYQSVLQTLPNNHEDFPSLYHGLGYIQYVKGNYTEALEYDRIAYEIRKKTLPENHLDVARSSLNLGCDYVRSGDHKKALELLMDALRIRRQAYAEQDHVNIAIVCAAIGDNYIHLGDYENASYFLTEALEMFKRVLPSEHLKIASTLTRIGFLWEKQGSYECAFQYYENAHSMAKNIMPSEHPTIHKYFRRIMGLYKKMNCIDKAIELCNKELSVQCTLLGEFHPCVAKFHSLLGDLNNSIEQKLLHFQKALEIWQKSYTDHEQEIEDCRSRINSLISNS